MALANLFRGRKRASPSLIDGDARFSRGLMDGRAERELYQNHVLRIFVFGKIHVSTSGTYRTVRSPSVAPCDPLDFGFAFFSPITRARRHSSRPIVFKIYLTSIQAHESTEFGP